MEKEAQTKECWCSLKARKGKEMNSLLDPRQGTHLNFSQDSFWTSDLERFKIINLNGFQQLNLLEQQ